MEKELIPGTKPWYDHYRTRANELQLQKLRQQDLHDEEARESGTPGSQVGCNNVVVPPRAPSTD